METNSLEPTAPDLFISYSREDRERVKPLVDALIAHGWIVRWDWRVNDGEQFHPRIEEALAGSACVIVLWSEHSIASPWVIAEAREGANKQKLVPVLLDEVSIPIAFHGIHTTDFTRWSGHANDGLVQTLIQDIDAVAGEPGIDTSVTQLAAANAAREVFKAELSVQKVEVDDIEQLQALRREVHVLASDFDLKHAKYKIENYLARHPNSIEARLLLEQTINEPVPAATRLRNMASGRRVWRLGAAGVLAAGVVAALLAVLSATRPDLATPDLLDAAFIAPDMVQIPAGTFKMGSDTSSFDHERPVLDVTVSSFELARNELTWAEWQSCEDEGGCNKIERPDFFDSLGTSERPTHPVVNVNISSVNEYLAWINEETGRSYRLPSNVEWEYATRAGSTTDYYWGDAIGEKRANCRGCGSQWDGQSTSPVGSFDENPFGLNDMHGNVWEWTAAECRHVSYEGAPIDGSARLNNCSVDDRHPVRGGAWFDEPVNLRAAYRVRVEASVAYNVVGFRLARTLP